MPVPMIRRLRRRRLGRYVQPQGGDASWLLLSAAIIGGMYLVRNFRL